MVLQIHTFLGRFQTFNSHSQYFEAASLIILLLVLSFLIDLFLSRSFVGRYYRIFLAPGVIVHELSHAAGCLLTGAQIKKINLFEKNGGSVEHLAPKIPILGQIVVSLAPFAMGIFVIYVLSHYFFIKSYSVLNLHWYENILQNFLGIINNFPDFNLKSVIVVYLIISVGVTMTPSIVDIKNTLFPLFLLGVLVIILTCIFSFKISNIFFMANLVQILYTVTILLIFVLVLSMIMFGVTKVVTKR